MANTLIISPLNPIRFANRDNKQPNWENTLNTETSNVEGTYVQKFIEGEEIILQARSDAPTNLVGFVTNCETNVRTEIFPVIAKTFDDFTFSKFSLNLDEGKYYLDIALVGVGIETPKYKRSEHFEIVKGDIGIRDSLAGIDVYKIIKDHVLVESWNNENSFDNYFGIDDQGATFKSRFWLPTQLHHAQVGGETEVYDNLEVLTKLEDTNQNSFEFTAENIPRYLAMQMQYVASLDNFFVGDLEFVSLEKGEIEYLGQYYQDGTLIMTLTQRFAEGLNSDDQGFEIITNGDMAGIEILQATGVSGTGSFTVKAGYMINSITNQLNQGTNAIISFGTAPSGTDIQWEEELTNTERHSIVNTQHSHDTDVDYQVYYTIVGVGSTVNLVVQTILNKQ